MKAHLPLASLFLAAIALVFFFPGTAGAGVFYVSISFLFLALLLASLGKGFARGLDYLGLAPKRNEAIPLAKSGALALVVSCVVAGALSALLYFLGYLDTASVEEKILSLPLPALIAAFTLAPLAEEALFRGYLFRKISEIALTGRQDASPARVAGAGSLSGAFPSAAGAILSSLLFAAAHFSYGSVAELGVAFSIGMVFCHFTLKSKSLVPAVLAHASFNLLSILMAVFL